MTTCLRLPILAAALVALVTPAARAEDKPIVPLRVQLVISRYNGEKKVSSLPYTFMVNANAPKTSIRMGAQVPILTSMSTGNAPPAFSYRDVGVNIDCSASPLDDNRFRLDFSIDDSSVYGEEASASAAPDTMGRPRSFRSFRIVEGIVVRDGQPTQFTAAVDKVSGEVTKLDVTVNVVK